MVGSQDHKDRTTTTLPDTGANALLAARVLPESRLGGLASDLGYEEAEGLAAAIQALPGF